MSFGFLTESALLPSKSKPIQVDGRSLVDLKAVVYAKEQKVRLDGSGGGSSSGGLRGLRGKRAAAGDAGGAAARKDPFARTNRGVEERSQRDELERVTASKKKKKAERTMAAKSRLYEKMAHGEVGASHAAGSLVDFTRKTGADLAVLTAKASKSKRQSIPETADQLGEDYDDANSKRESNGKKRRRTNAPSGRSSKHNAARESEIEDDRRFSKSQQDDDDEEDDGEGDRDSAEVRIQDEFGRDRTVFRGSSEHKLHLLAKRAAKERQAELVAETEAFDERYSYRGNWGSTHPAASPPPPPPPPPPLPPHAAMSTSASGGTVGNDPAGGWAWSSGVGRGADAGDFETREGQEAIASKKMAELLEREGGGGSETGRDIGGAKILSQWERTLTGDQKNYLKEVQDETEAGRRNTSTKSNDRKSQREKRKQLLRQKQEARAARLRDSGTP